MRRAAAFSRTVRQVVSGRSSRPWTFLGALAFGFTASLIALAAPAARDQLARIAAQSVRDGAGWELGVVAGGLVLLGGAALMFVLARLAREAEARPYASLGPVLAVFSALTLIGLHAPLPLTGVSSELLAVFALLVALCGGGLVRASALSTQLGGLALAMFPALSLVGLLWALSGEADPGRALGALAPRTLAYVGMLLVCSFGIALVATLGRLPSHTPSDGDAPEEERGTLSWRGVFLAAVALVVASGGLNVALSRPRRDAPPAAAAFEEASAAAQAQPTTSPVHDLEPRVAQLESPTEGGARDQVDAPPSRADDDDTQLALVAVHLGDDFAETHGTVRAHGRRRHAHASRADDHHERVRRGKVARREKHVERAVPRRASAVREAPPPWGEVLTQVAPPRPRTEPAPAAAPAPARAVTRAQPPTDDPARIAAQAGAQRTPVPRSTGDGSLDDLMSKALGK
ncbi:MAG: hypothetical protein ABW252_07845 [Polyangiales bacterium]